MNARGRSLPGHSIAGLAATLVALLAPLSAVAHPVPRRAHDRVIDLRIEPGRITIRYRLEVDPVTVMYDDLPAVDDQIDRAALKKPDDYYAAFARCYAPILAGNLSARLDGKPLALRCTQHGHTLRDDDGKPLDHVRCDFQMVAEWSPNGDLGHKLDFHEGNYELEAGMIRLGLTSAGGVEIVDQTVPSKELQERPARDLKPGDEDRLRKASATFRLPPIATASSVEPPMPEKATTGPGGDDDHGLLGLLFDDSRGLWLLLLFAGIFGAAHALTPGHGKTLVAAYLVGERGTVWHAFILGLSTTLSHTGVVILAAVLVAVFGIDISGGMQLVAALVLTGFGFWLLLRRLSGGADHFHFGGHSHGGGAWHTHGHGAEAEHSHAHGADLTPVGTWGVILLGMVGGMVPCWDAIVILIVALRMQMVSLALPLVLAFSAGLAATLVAVGIGVVYIKGFSESRWGQGRIVKALPLVSATVILGIGLWMCYRVVHPQ